MSRWLWCLGLGLMLACEAPAEEAGVLREPGPFRIRTIDGETTSRIAADRGLVSVHADDVSQTLSWQPRSGAITAVAQHELDLVVESARSTGDQPAIDAPVHDDRVGEQAAASWSAQVASTSFLGTVTDCPRAWVVLVTFGPSESTTQRVHRETLDSLACAR